MQDDHHFSAPLKASPIVSSMHVHGAYVYGANGEYLGKINHLLIDKATGSIAYAVMIWGGFWGVVPNEHPIAWVALHYDSSRDAYVSDLSRAELEACAACAMTRLEGEDLEADKSYDYTRSSYEFFNAPYYW